MNKKQEENKQNIKLNQKQLRYSRKRDMKRKKDQKKNNLSRRRRKRKTRQAQMQEIPMTIGNL